MLIYFALFDLNLFVITQLHSALILILGSLNNFHFEELKINIFFFYRFVANQPGRLEHIIQIKEATKHLYEELIPEFMKELYLIESKTKDLKTISIKELMHKRGINLFMMGHLRSLLKSESFFKKLVLVEMVARVAKHQINQALREKMQEIKLALQQVCKLNRDFLF